MASIKPADEASASAPAGDLEPDGRAPRFPRAVDGAPQMVVVYRNEPASHMRGHESATRHELGRRLAAIKKLDFAGEFDHGQRYDAPLYYLPGETLCRSEMRADLGIRDEHDLFGGVVPLPFVATKVITHGLVAPHASAPAGWSHALGGQMEQVVLPGFSVFSADDARAACKRLLAKGGVRVKKASGIGGLGQWVVGSLDELDAVLAGLAFEELHRFGLVLELNLSADVQTHSVGQVRVGSLTATYCGTQYLARNNHGAEVYGGSTLTVVRGDFDVLKRRDLAPEVRHVIAQAGAYHAFALAAFPSMFASRCNYDVVTGSDGEGRHCSGVLEQSWRAGGASGAEIAALEAFQADPALDVVTASTTEIYGEGVKVPPDAVVYFNGVDEHVGRLTKYARLESYVNQ
jgi:hypothetical protein